jgi:hypothetical protein
MKSDITKALEPASNGKGDEPRHSLNREWRERIDDINWHREQPDGFKQVKAGRRRKTYR